jgi:uncharacterized membrane protein
VGDVFTAIAVLDRLTTSLALLMTRGEAPRSWRDEDGAPRVFGPAPTFADMLDASYNQIREAAAGRQHVLLRQADSLAKLASLAEPHHDAALRRHLGLVGRAAERCLPDDLERGEVEARVREGLAALDGRAGGAPER